MEIVSDFWCRTQNSPYAAWFIQWIFKYTSRILLSCLYNIILFYVTLLLHFHSVVSVGSYCTAQGTNYIRSLGIDHDGREYWVTMLHGRNWHILFIFLFLLKYSWFTMFSQFLLYSHMTQSYIYIQCFPYIIFHHVLSQEIGFSFLYCTVGSHCDPF